MKDLRKFKVTYGDNPSRYADGEIQEMKSIVILATSKFEATTRVGAEYVQNVDELFSSAFASRFSKVLN